MTTLTYDQAEPLSSSEMSITDADRAADIDQKQRLVGEFLESHRYDALLLQKPENFAWLTSGGDSSRAGSSESIACLFITPEARVVVTTNASSAQLFERELAGLGFQLKERAWHEPKHRLVEDLCRGRTVASDTGFRGTDDVSVHLIGMRTPLTPLECERARELGRAVSHAVEATCRRCRPGRTEADVAGEVAHRLMKRRIVAERIQVMGDGAATRYPHWSYADRPVQRCATVVALGRRGGLCLGAARTVAFDTPPRELRDAHQRAVLVEATGIFFSQPEWELFEVWNRVERIYEKYGLPDEWRLADQAEVTGYQVCEVPVVPNSEFRLSARMALHWHPKVGPAVVGDSILVGDDRVEILTPMESWPRLKVEIKGIPVYLPGILQRAPGTATASGDDSRVGDDSVLG